MDFAEICCVHPVVSTTIPLVTAELQSQLEIVQHSVEQQAAQLADKEREAVRRVQAAREEEWAKLHTVENEKLVFVLQLSISHEEKKSEHFCCYVHITKRHQKVRETFRPEATSCCCIAVLASLFAPQCVIDHSCQKSDGLMESCACRHCRCGG